MLANPSRFVWTAQKQAANTFANCWRQIETCLPTWVYQHEFAIFSLPCEGRFNTPRLPLLSSFSQSLHGTSPILERTENKQILYIKQLVQY